MAVKNKMLSEISHFLLLANFFLMASHLPHIENSNSNNNVNSLINYNNQIKLE